MYVPLASQPILVLLNLTLLFLLLRTSSTSENRTEFAPPNYKDLANLKRTSFRNVSDQERRSSSSSTIHHVNQAKAAADLDEPMISMASNVVPKYFVDQQKAYHQQFDHSAQPSHKKAAKPKLGQQISLLDQRSSSDAESVQSSSILFAGGGGSFHSEFGKEYPYKPTFLRFNPADGRTQLDTKPPSGTLTVRMDSREGHSRDGQSLWDSNLLLDKKYPSSSNVDYTKESIYKPNQLNQITSQMTNYPPKSSISYPPNHQPNYNDPNEKYESIEQTLPTIKEPQITYSKHPVAMPLYSNYQPAYGEEPPAYKPTDDGHPNSRESYDPPKYSLPSNQPSMTYSAPSYSVSKPIGQPMGQPVVHSVGQPISQPMAPQTSQPINHPPMIHQKPNFRPKEYNPANYNVKPKYVVEHRPVNSQPVYSPDDKSLEKTIADLPNMLAAIPGLLPDVKQFVTAPIRIETPKLPTGDKPVLVQVPRPISVMRQPPPSPPRSRYVKMNQMNQKESEEAHKKHQYDSHTMVSGLNGNNYNRLHKDEFYSNNNGYQTSHYVQASKEVRPPHTTYMNNSELNDYESSYSETRYVDEAKRLNDTKDYYLVYKVDDRRLDDELNEQHINHHLSSAEERINNAEDYHEVITNLSPLIEGDGLEKLFTIDTMNSVMKDGKSDEFGSNELYADPQANGERPTGRPYKDANQPSKQAAYHSMRNRDQLHKQFNVEDGREVHVKYQPSYDNKENRRHYHNGPPPPVRHRPARKNQRSIDSLEYEADSTHHTPDLKRISGPLSDLKYRHNLTDHSSGYRNNQTARTSRSMERAMPERLTERLSERLSERSADRLPADKAANAPIPHHYVDIPVDRTPPIEHPNRFEPERSRLDHSERIYLFSNSDPKQSERSPKTYSNDYTKNQDKPEFSKSEFKSEYKSEFSPEYKATFGKQDFKQDLQPEYKSERKSEFKSDFKPEYIQESFKSEFNDQLHKKESSVERSSVLKVKSYDDYLHENYGKAERPGY